MAGAPPDSHACTTIPWEARISALLKAPAQPASSAHDLVVKLHYQPNRLAAELGADWWRGRLANYDFESAPPMVKAVCCASPLALLVRRSVQALTSPQHAWTLRILAAVHPAVVFPALPLLLARGGCPAAPADELGRDGDGEAEDGEAARVAEGVLDVLDALSVHLVHDEARLSLACDYVIATATSPRGQRARAAMAGAVARCLSLLHEWACAAPELTRERLRGCFRGDAGAALGALQRVAFYHPSSAHAALLCAWFPQTAAAAAAPAAASTPAAAPAFASTSAAAEAWSNAVAQAAVAPWTAPGLVGAALAAAERGEATADVLRALLLAVYAQPALAAGARGSLASRIEGWAADLGAGAGEEARRDRALVQAAAGALGRSVQELQAYL